MALNRVRVWGEEQLTFADLNNEFNNLCDNVLIEPFVATTNVDLDGKALILDSDGNTTIDAVADNTINVTINGASDFTLTPNLLTAISGSSILLANGNITSTVGNLTITNGATTLADPDARTTTVATPLTVSAETTGTPASGIGTGILFTAESADEVPSTFGQLDFSATDVTAGSEDTFARVWLRVAGAALVESFRWVSTGVASAIFTHANSTSRTYTFPNYDGTIPTIAGSETFTNKTLTTPTLNSPVTGGTWTGASIGTGALKTAAGATSGTTDGAGTVINIAMNDYSFSPNIQKTGGGDPLFVMGYAGADSSTSTARFGIKDNAGAANPYVIRWQYFTASDDPTIWIVVDGFGNTIATWVSDDPLPNGMPGVSIPGCTSHLIKAAQLDQLSVLNDKASQAADLIDEQGLKMENQSYRALQLQAMDKAPSQWILANCTFDPASGKLAQAKR